jgi:cobalamin biosynthesis protein cobD
LGGNNYYFGEPHFRAYMGEARREIEADDIQKTVRLMYTVTILFLLLTYGGFLLWQQRGMFF